MNSHCRTTATYLQETTEYTRTDKGNKNVYLVVIGGVVGVILPIGVFCTLYMYYKRSKIIFYEIITIIVVQMHHFDCILTKTVDFLIYIKQIRYRKLLKIFNSIQF